MMDCKLINYKSFVYILLKPGYRDLLVVFGWNSQLLFKYSVYLFDDPFLCKIRLFEEELI